MEDVRSFIATHDLPLINKTNFRVCFFIRKNIYHSPKHSFL
jgi:hypothetical protein